MSTDPLIPARCPVCAYTVCAPFFPAENHPLATIAWPEDPQSAVAMPRLPLEFVQCPRCTHVFNRAFDYRDIPYADKPNRMFNRGNIWRGHLAQTRDLLLEMLPASPTLVEIGCGDGHFLKGLAEDGTGRYLGFDPHGGGESTEKVQLHARLFEPLTDVSRFAPDGVILRHVLEHLTDPCALLTQIAWAAAGLGKPCLLFVEVPCIDRVFGTDRLADFYYEHVSQFTTRSFTELLSSVGEIMHLAHGYDGEVVFGLVRLGVRQDMQLQAANSRDFAGRSQSNRAAIAAQLETLAASGKRVAIWGGTGKAAAFMHHYGIDRERFPLVVDSDADKVGTFVPGVGQRIEFRDALKGQSVDVVIIPPQWRARDILAEMKREGIAVATVLIEHQGRLIDFESDAHPY
ncbi:MAG: class I SAM-dependent methyltransferase [Proteobacteria bacterium]|nr:class I SAM-dependent methyltransferase [Pseudomonadota bacterium]